MMVDISLIDQLPIAAEIAEVGTGRLLAVSPTWRVLFPKLETSIRFALSPWDTGSREKAEKDDTIDVFGRAGAGDAGYPQPEFWMDSSPDCRSPSVSGVRYFWLRTQQIQEENPAVAVTIIEDATKVWRQAAERGVGLKMADAMIESIFRARREEKVDGFKVKTIGAQDLCGDFAFARRRREKKAGTLTLWAIGDCSGHGINSGVLKALIGVMLEDEFGALELKYLSGGEIEENPAKGMIDRVQHKLATCLHDSGLQEADSSMSLATRRFGFDAAFVVISLEGDSGKLWYCSAGMPFWRIRKDESPTQFGRWSKENDFKAVRGERLGASVVGEVDAMPSDRFIGFTDGVVELLRERTTVMLANAPSKRLKFLSYFDKWVATMMQIQAEHPGVDDAMVSFLALRSR